MDSILESKNYFLKFRKIILDEYLLPNIGKLKKRYAKNQGICIKFIKNEPLNNI